MQTVTNESVVPNRPEGDGFHVSCTTGTDITGAILNVMRCRWVTPERAARMQARGALSLDEPRSLDALVQVMVRVPDHGRQFPSVEAARAFALERGYTRRYITSPDLRARRVQRAGVAS